MAQIASALEPDKNVGSVLLPRPCSPTSARPLTASMITLATGERELEELEELELIFGGVSEIGGLERCIRLHTLTLIDCGLQRISNLEPVSQSLVKLCLCDQGLKKMENLYLPVLRELYLHQNKIAKIESLDGCPSLRRLWLFSNRITLLEGLHYCGALQELLLHGNRITKVIGLESLVHLQNLGLAGNPIAGVRQLVVLRSLPSLMELNLDDIHFGTCPVVKAEGYRDFVMCVLRQVRCLDGFEIAEPDREEVEGKYEAEALAYEQKLEEIERKRVREIHQAEMARDIGAKQSTELKAEMMRALEGLEELVKEGRAAMDEQRSRQEEIHASNLRVLEASLAELQEQYCREVDKRVHAEEAKAEEEERLFAALEERTCLEREYSQLIARQQMGVGMEGIAVQELSDHSPDLQKLRREVWANQRTHSGQVELINVLRACRLYNRRLCEDFVSAAGESAQTIRLYIGLSGRDVDAVCREGLSALSRPAAILFPDPKQTAQPLRVDEGVEGKAASYKDSIGTKSKCSGHATTNDVAHANKYAAATTARAVDNRNGVGRDGDGGESDLRVILRLAVVLLEGDGDVVDVTVAEGTNMDCPRVGGVDISRQTEEVRRRTSEGRREGPPEGGVSGRRERGRAGRDRRNPSPALVERAVVMGKIVRVSFSPPESDEGNQGQGQKQEQNRSCFVLPAKYFSRALPEFHLLCASGAVAEDRRALDAALGDISADAPGPALETDLISRLEAKLDAEVMAYLGRLQQEVTADEASNLQSIDARLRSKAASLTSLRSEVDRERALQESLLREGSHP